MADDCLQPALKCHYQWIIKTSYFSSMKNNIDEKIKLLSKLYTADFVFFLMEGNIRVCGVIMWLLYSYFTWCKEAKNIVWKLMVVL